jgi:hypothetical protein
MTGFTGRFHSEEIVRGPDGSKYFVRVGRTGVHRWTSWGGLPNLTAVVFTWQRYLGRGTRTWTVTARRRGFVYQPDFISEEYADRPAAGRRADEIAEAIAAGRQPNGPPHRA